MLVGTSPFGKRKRDLGLDWPAEAETMIGMQRLTSLQRCVETVLADDIPWRSDRMWGVARRGLHPDASGFGSLWG